MPSYISKNGEWVEVSVAEAKKAEVAEVKVEEKEEKVEVVEVKDEAPTYDELDVNRDGNVDDKDASIAGKVLNAVKEKKPRGRKKDSKKKTS